MKDAITYKLKHPITVGSETITEVKIGRIKGKHMRSMPADKSAFTMSVIMDLAGKVTSQASVVLDEMDSEDLMEVVGIVGEKLAGGQTTGESA